MKTYFNQKPIVKISLIFFIAYTIIVVFKLALSNYIVNNIYSSLISKIFTLIIFSILLTTSAAVRNSLILAAVLKDISIYLLSKLLLRSLEVTH